MAPSFILRSSFDIVRSIVSGRVAAAAGWVWVGLWLDGGGGRIVDAVSSMVCHVWMVVDSVSCFCCAVLCLRAIDPQWLFGRDNRVQIKAMSGIRSRVLDG